MIRSKLDLFSVNTCADLILIQVILSTDMPNLEMN